MANNPTQLTILQDEIRRRYDTLSKRLKQVARYILDNSNSVAGREYRQEKSFERTKPSP